jgi:hypothetical protein
MAEVGNLDTCLGCYFSLFSEVSNLLGKIIHPVTIIIRVIGLMAGCF